MAMQLSGAAFLFSAPILHALDLARDSTVHLMAGGVALVLFGVLDRLERFSAWGLSATLKEAEKAAEEAKASAAEVRTLALRVLRLSVSIVHAGGRLDEQQRARGIVEAEAARLLSELQASVAERREVFAEADAMRLHDLSADVTNALLESGPAEQRQAVQEEIKKHGEAWSRGDAAPSSAALRSFIAAHGAVAPPVDEALTRLAAAEAKRARGEVLDRPST